MLRSTVFSPAAFVCLCQGPRFHAGTELGGAYLVLSNALVADGDTQTAIDVVNKSIAIDPSNPNLYRTLVNMYAVTPVITPKRRRPPSHI
jgi:hypothetical protein